TGGPGLVENRRLDSLQVRSVVTFLFHGLGHHILKLGLDVDASTYDHTFRDAELRELHPRDVIISFRRQGYLIGPDQEVDLNFVQIHSRGMLAGGFIQDSWNIVDRVTLNAGLRYDSQTLYGPDGRTFLAFPGELSPRLGVVWDFTQQGRSKI